MRVMKRFLYEYVPAWLLLVIFGLIVVHAPLTVFIGSHIPALGLVVKAWKECLMVVVAILIGWQYAQRGKWRTIRRDYVVLLSLGYIALHLLVAVFSRVTGQALVAGLMIDLRYIVYFLLVYLYLALYPSYRQSFLKIGIVGVVIALGFTMLELVLPRHFLAYLGYSEATIKPYILLDENPAFVRFNGTLRGPNPLGAYAMIISTTLVSFVLVSWRRLREHHYRWLLVAGGVAALITEWVSYSRSAWLGLVVALVALFVATTRHVLTKRTGIITAVIIVVGIVAAVGLQSTTFYKNVILHDNPGTGAHTTSDQGHASSLVNGLARALREPLGSGVGSTGSASLLGSSPLIIENQYLMIAHETGWIGLALFLALWALVLRRLWYARRDWRARAVFASGLGLAVICLMWPVLTDDTVSIIWWGLAAVVLSGTKGGFANGTTTNKKAKRTA